jgi:RNA polymerase sigma factor (sigma-70 family)
VEPVVVVESLPRRLRLLRTREPAPSRPRHRRPRLHRPRHLHRRPAGHHPRASQLGSSRRPEARHTAAPPGGFLPAAPIRLHSSLMLSEREPDPRLRTIGGVGQPLPDNAVIAASITTPAEFASIFHRHFDVVHSYIRKRVGRSLADDLAAQTFLVAFDRRAEYDQARPNARPWLLGIATNLIHSKRRQEKRQLRAYRRTGAEAAVDFLEGIESRADAGRLRSQLVAALAALPKEEVDPLLLFAWADLTYDEIAAALEIPIGTVKSRISRARKRIREQLSLQRTTGDQTPTASLEIDHG